jgi:hypothetical protein
LLPDQIIQPSQVEYLNSGICFSWSLVALNTAWSGYHGFDFEAGAVLVLAAPVVVVGAGRVPEAGAVLDVVVDGTGVSTNLS